MTQRNKQHKAKTAAGASAFTIDPAIRKLLANQPDKIVIITQKENSVSVAGVNTSANDVAALNALLMVRGFVETKEAQEKSLSLAGYIQTITGIAIQHLQAHYPDFLVAQEGDFKDVAVQPTQQEIEDAEVIEQPLNAAEDGRIRIRKPVIVKDGE
jgi:hypothetical protein